MTDAFMIQNEALRRVDGRLASRPPRDVFWVTLTCLQTVVPVEHTVMEVDHKERGRAHMLVVKITIERIR